MKHLVLVMTLVLAGQGLAQINIVGEASVRFEYGGADCGGYARRVDLFVDVTGLSGDGGLAGLNAYVLKLSIQGAPPLELIDVFGFAEPGDDPTGMDWTIHHTNPGLIGLNHDVTIVGYSTNYDAPNREYLVATLVFSSKTEETYTLELDVAGSSLASRLTEDFGLDSINIAQGVTPFVLILPVFVLDFGIGCVLWRSDDAQYDLVAPSGIIDVLDLVQLVDCSPK